MERDENHRSEEHDAKGANKRPDEKATNDHPHENAAHSAADLERLCSELSALLQSGSVEDTGQLLARLPPALREAAEKLLVDTQMGALQSEAMEQCLQEFRDAAEQVLASDFLHLSAQNSAVGDTDSHGTGDPADIDVEHDAMPEHIGRFAIQRELGKGAFGMVYLAFDPKLERPVALKLPGPRLLASGVSVEVFLREARTAANLSHPGLVSVFDVGSEGDRPYIVQEFIDGPNLEEWYTKRGRPSPQTAVRIVIEIAEAMGYAHQRGFFHRDLKPRNILLDPEDHVHVADFGLAVHESTQHRMHGDVSGTPAYMSPEQVRGETHRLDGRTDIWSLGVILYELLTGQRPFRSTTRREIFEEILTKEPRPLRQIDPSISPELERICQRCLTKRQSDRCTSAAELLDDLRSWLLGGAARGPSGDGRRRSPTAAGAPAQSGESSAAVIPKGLRAFDEHDADFYLRLLPGPHDREGLPESVRLWKKQIEQFDAEKTFAVGLLYGPSGCGKSSLLRAGLLPRLSKSIVHVVVDATAEDTEARLRRQLSRYASAEAAGAPLPELFRSLRTSGIGEGRKLLIVIDQLEQWLHANPTPDDTELVAALRHCDGTTIQTLCTVRDDFGMAATRFMDALDIPIVQGHNFATVDLFDTDHARHVLTLFGQAFGRLPADSHLLTAEQQEFLAAVVRGLAQDGKVVSVRLALFAEMIKSDPWVPATLQAVGGTHGIGVNFLEDTFVSRKANPKHRQHEPAARQLLAALLPEVGSNIKGHMRSRSELQHAAGYEARPQAFQELLHILDVELRLITPTDPDGATSDASNAADASAAPAGYYQLTHDYLVPALREWLTRKQKATRRGRAELLLAERASLWAPKPEDRYLPSSREFVRIALLVPHAMRTEPQQRMMRRAAFVHGRLWGGAVAALLVLGVLVGIAFHRIEQEDIRAAVNTLAHTHGADVPGSIRPLEAFSRKRVLAELRDRFAAKSSTETERLGVAYGLAHFGEVEHAFLLEQLRKMPASEIDNLVAAWRADEEAGRAALERAVARAQAAQDWEAKARLATLALHVGDESIAAEMLALRPNPVQQTTFIDVFSTWSGDLRRIAAVVRETEDAALRYGICSALVKNPGVGDDVKLAWRDVLTDWYENAPDGGTHSASGLALRHWELPLPKLAASPDIGPQKDWQLTPKGLTMVRIPAGQFERVDVTLLEPTTHTVRISQEFLLTNTEVTVGLMKQFMEDKEYPHDKPETWLQDPVVTPTEDHAANNVPWYTAVMFCNWLSWREGLTPCYEKTGEMDLDSDGKPTQEAWRLVKGANGYRLPTEAEWEYASRAGTKTSFYFGDDVNGLVDHAHLGGMSSYESAPVGSKLCSAWGLFDMYGNMAEWCHDWYGEYPQQDVVDPIGPLTAESRVVRGGGFQAAAEATQPAARHFQTPRLGSITQGFRVVRVPQGSAAAE